MNRNELIEKLNELGVPEDKYSLDGDFGFDRLVVYKNYSKWEVFYMDEKGLKGNVSNFYVESLMYQYVYDFFKNHIEHIKKYNLNH